MTRIQTCALLISNNFRFHLYWHRGLYHLERHEFDEVLKLYDDHVASDIATDMYLDVCNAASMLWRLEMYGVDIGNRWKDLTEVSLRHVDDHDLVFVSLHYLIALRSEERLLGNECVNTCRSRWSQST